MPKILSGLSDVRTSPGATAELKCYLLTVPGLETRWATTGFKDYYPFLRKILA